MTDLVRNSTVSSTDDHSGIRTEPVITSSSADADISAPPAPAHTPGHCGELSSALPAPLLGGVLPWLARHEFVLHGMIMVTADEAVILVDRGQPEPGRRAADRWVTWRVYARQAEPELGSYFVNYWRALQSLAARAGLL